MKSWMATAAALALLAGLSTAGAQNAPAPSNKTDNAMEQSQSAAPKVRSPHKTRIHQTMRMRRHPRETTGSGARPGTIGSGVNDPSIHQTHGDRDSRGYPKQH